MHPAVFDTFEKILSGKDLSGPVLEVGAVPSEKTLLNLPSLANLPDKTGINMDGPYTFKDYLFIRGNANCMDMFPDDHFGIVLCNAMFEHDKYFWKSLAEIKRVTSPGGWVFIGTPGYAGPRFRKLKDRFGRNDWYKKLQKSQWMNRFLVSTPTLELHGDVWGDFYRFSPAAFREVFFEGYREVTIMQIMNPPRIIGSGRKA